MYEGTNNHMRILGIVEVVYGVLHALGALVVAALSLLGCGGCFAAESAGDALGVLFTSAALGGGALIASLLFCFIALAGFALMNGRGWAKIATIIFAVISIANFPIGTIFAVYALWVIFMDQKNHV